MPFNRNLLGELRPNQIITTFGPGSIVDAVKDSVTVLDTNYWKEKGKKIRQDALIAGGPHIPPGLLPYVKTGTWMIFPGAGGFTGAMTGVMGLSESVLQAIRQRWRICTFGAPSVMLGAV